MYTATLSAEESEHSSNYFKKLKSTLPNVSLPSIDDESVRVLDNYISLDHQVKKMSSSKYLYPLYLPRFTFTLFYCIFVIFHCMFATFPYCFTYVCVACGD